MFTSAVEASLLVSEALVKSPVSMYSQTSNVCGHLVEGLNTMVVSSVEKLILIATFSSEIMYFN